MEAGSKLTSRTSESPPAPGAAVQAWGAGGGGALCVRVIFSHLPLLSPTDPGWGRPGFRKRGLGLHTWVLG